MRGGLHVQDMAAALFRDAFSSFNALMYLVVAALLGAEIVLVIAPIVISVRYAPLTQRWSNASRSFLETLYVILCDGTPVLPFELEAHE